ncbi:ArdC-like ssDNA-binding domain-containing protein [Deinococcus hopiensis]|uniref:N-terminal domain-containing protein n=1 Tax=Deinococcus hopiensis KR-140 TaxID=695939 RepID=A0A1W1U9U2_9DEIO|nr:ArdC-like ssDNA-binding domain-containing protein [Deinococcus hopiensis]SMB77812.1 hypothetical protein SAMN00790413_03936 [Deinococcus hopiensis KR-140]
MTTDTAPAAPIPAAELLRQVEHHVEHLAQGGSIELLAYLAFAARFHTYSVNNQVLILLSAPEARFVAGIKTWNQQGRRVRKGAKGIKILAPMTRRVEENGEEKRALVGFRTVTVFPDTATEGDPLPETSFMTAQEGGDLALFDHLVSHCPYPVKWEPLSRAHGMTDGGVITLDPDRCATPAQRIRVLFHEWAHAALHFQGAQLRAEDLPDRQTRELEADAAAYVLASLHGVEATAAVSDYLTTWGGNAEKLRASLGRIHQAVSSILGRFQNSSRMTPQAAD